MKIGVFNQYQIIRGKNIVLKGEGEVRYYSLKDVDYIYNKIANINTSGDTKDFEEHYIAFCKSYGCLGVAELNVSPKDATFEEIKSELLFTEENISFAKNEIDYFKKIIKIYQQLGSDQLEQEIERLSQFHSQNKPRLFSELLNSCSKKVKHKNYLNSYLHSRLFTFTEALAPNEKGDFIPYPYSTSLIGYAYWELKKIILTNENINQCLNCGEYFNSKHPNAKFCGKGKGTAVHKACENSYNARKFRARNSHKKGKSIENIAKSINRPIDEVREWIHNYQPNSK